MPIMEYIEAVKNTVAETHLYGKMIILHYKRNKYIIKLC